MFGDVVVDMGSTRTVGVLAKVYALPALMFVLVGTCLFSATGASAGVVSWSSPLALDRAGGPGQALTGLVCVLVSQCTAVDGIGQELTFYPEVQGSVGLVLVDSGVNHEDGAALLTGLACPSASQCTAVDSIGREVTFNPTAPENASATTLDAAGFLRAVACPTVSQCTAVEDGREVTFDPAAPRDPSPVSIDSNGVLVSVACRRPRSAPRLRVCGR